MNGDRIQSDMQYLAGEMHHRGANTDGERVAAEYIRDRFGEYTPNTEIDDFYSIESYYYLFASYYAEFCIVALVALLSARVALCYGAVVFLAYLCEFMGYHVFSRLLPHFETQNVVARFMAARPKRLLIATAHYDSPRDAVFTNPRFLPWLRTVHQAVLVCMLVVLLSCAIQAVGLLEAAPIPVIHIARWTAVCFLVCCAAAMFYSASRGEFVRGANGNASGTAALIDLARRLASDPIEDADVWLVATGSKDSWMNGMHHFLTSSASILDRDNTYFLDIEHVGEGQLHYTTAEGMLHLFPNDPELVAAAEAVGNTHGALPVRLKTVPTDALLPLARGYKAMTVIALNENGVPENWHWHTDTLMRTDSAIVEKAVDLAEAVLRRLAPQDDQASDKPA